MIRRREFIALLGSAAAAWPLAARAQQPERTRSIGVLMGFTQSDLETTARVEKFRQELAKLGWRDGHNVRIEWRFGGGSPDRFAALAKELVAQQPDVIVGHTTPVVAALNRETRTIPVVFVTVSDPIGSGFIASLARPSRNFTGVLRSERDAPEIFSGGRSAFWGSLLFAPILLRPRFAAARLQDLHLEPIGRATGAIARA